MSRETHLSPWPSRSMQRLPRLWGQEKGRPEAPLSWLAIGEGRMVLPEILEDGCNHGVRCGPWVRGSHALRDLHAHPEGSLGFSTGAKDGAFNRAPSKNVENPRGGVVRDFYNRELHPIGGGVSGLSLDLRGQRVRDGRIADLRQGFHLPVEAEPFCLVKAGLKEELVQLLARLCRVIKEQSKGEK